MSARPEKHVEIMALIKTCVEAGSYFDTRHATERQSERSITRLDVAYVLTSGRHEARKDQFNEEFNSWNYAVRGKTRDERDLRIVVTFEESTRLLVITAIEILKKG